MGRRTFVADRRLVQHALLIAGLVWLVACGGGAAPSGGSNAAPTAGAGGGTLAPAPTSKAEVLPEDIVLMDDAAIERSSEGLMEYRVARPIAEVVEFYRAELPGLGWKPVGNPNVMEKIATLAFNKDKKSLTVNLQFNEKAASTLVRLFWQGY